MFKITKYCLAVALFITVAIGIEGLTMAMTAEEATAKIEKKAADKGYTAKEMEHAISTMTHLIEQGIPVEHACEVVMEALKKGIKDKEAMTHMADRYSTAVSKGMGHKDAVEETICPSCPMDHDMDHKMDMDIKERSMGHDLGISHDNMGRDMKH